MRYKLNVNELDAITRFIREYDWQPIIDGNKILARYIYDTAKQLYGKLKQNIEREKEMHLSIEFSELEMLTIAILAQREHENQFIQSTINKIIMEIPFEITSILKPMNQFVIQ